MVIIKLRVGKVTGRRKKQLILKNRYRKIRDLIEETQRETRFPEMC